MNPTDWVVRSIRRYIPATIVVPKRNGEPGWLVALVLWDSGYAGDESDAINAAHVISRELKDVAEFAHNSMSLDAPHCKHCGTFTENENNTDKEIVEIPGGSTHD